MAPPHRPRAFRRWRCTIVSLVLATTSTAIRRAEQVVTQAGEILEVLDHDVDAGEARPLDSRRTTSTGSSPVDTTRSSVIKEQHSRAAPVREHSHWLRRESFSSGVVGDQQSTSTFGGEAKFHDDEEDDDDDLWLKGRTNTIEDDKPLSEQEEISVDLQVSSNRDKNRTSSDEALLRGTTSVLADQGSQPPTTNLADDKLHVHDEEVDHAGARTSFEQQQQQQEEEQVLVLETSKKQNKDHESLGTVPDEQTRMEDLSSFSFSNVLVASNATMIPTSEVEARLGKEAALTEVASSESRKIAGSIECDTMPRKRRCRKRTGAQLETIGAQHNSVILKSNGNSGNSIEQLLSLPSKSHECKAVPGYPESIASSSSESWFFKADFERSWPFSDVMSWQVYVWTGVNPGEATTDRNYWMDTEDTKHDSAQYWPEFVAFSLANIGLVRHFYWQLYYDCADVASLVPNMKCSKRWGEQTQHCSRSSKKTVSTSTCAGPLKFQEKGTAAGTRTQWVGRGDACLAVSSPIELSANKGWLFKQRYLLQDVWTMIFYCGDDAIYHRVNRDDSTSNKDPEYVDLEYDAHNGETNIALIYDCTTSTTTSTATTSTVTTSTATTSATTASATTTSAATTSATTTSATTTSVSSTTLRLVFHYRLMSVVDFYTK
ncbi:unnamed protein product [Amoebophrya sp. A25]|nr:unnamed protein product [Amoebophrya sp. A25]|eukprot:GSA25T00025639001.1